MTKHLCDNCQGELLETERRGILAVQMRPLDAREGLEAHHRNMVKWDLCGICVDNIATMFGEMKVRA